jgi:hypothetical protein
MIKLKVRIFILVLILAGLSLGFRPALGPVNQDAPPDICQQAENIMPNCNFDAGTNGWTPFLEEGSASFTVLQGGGECHAPLCPAGYIVTESYFVGGIYQQVPVAAGNTYYANIVWLVFDSLVNDASVSSVVGGISRKMGIDPTGGTDPRSPNIIWGPENTRTDCKICANQEVTATAQANTITVFLRIDDRWRQRAAEKGYNVPPTKDQFWLDDMGLKQVAGPAAPPPPTDTPAPPTATPPPPTETPVPQPPTATPIPATEEIAQVAPAQLSDAATEEPQAEAVPAVEPVSPVATPIPASMLAPPPTLTPSPTASPTATFAPRERPTATPTRPPRRAAAEEDLPFLPAGLMGIAGTTLCFGGVAFVLMMGVLFGLVWLYRLGWGKADPDEDEPGPPPEIVINLPENDLR